MRLCILICIHCFEERGQGLYRIKFGHYSAYSRLYFLCRPAGSPMLNLNSIHQSGGADNDEARPASTSDDVFERLRLAIVTGEIRPNTPLIEVDLAEALGVSRTPIRESLQRLAADELIVQRKRGWAVREYSPQEIQEAYEVRAA